MDGPSSSATARSVAERVPLVIGVVSDVTLLAPPPNHTRQPSAPTDDACSARQASRPSGRRPSGGVRAAGHVREHGSAAERTERLRRVHGGGFGSSPLAAWSPTHRPAAPVRSPRRPLRRSSDKHLPPRWSRNNPVDLAGGETKDTIPTVLEIAAGHPAVGCVRSATRHLGIQGNQGRMERTGPFPGCGLGRIVGFRAPSRRFTEAAAAVSPVRETARSPRRPSCR